MSDEYEYSGSMEGSESEYDYGSDDGGDDGYSEGDDDGEVDIAVDLENTYYLADDQFSEQQYDTALEQFQKVIELEKDNADEVAQLSERWSFKALEKIVVIMLKTSRFDQVLKSYRQLLAMMNEAFVTGNDRDKAIENVLANVSDITATAVSTQAHHVAEMYDITLKHLKSSKNHRLWFKTSCNLARLHVDLKNLDSVQPILKELYNSCNLPSGKRDPDKASDLLEVLALDIKLCHEKGDFAQMKKIYPETKSIVSAVEDVRIMGHLREQGGMMYMRDRQWTDAYHELFDSFMSYNESGKSGDAVRALKRMVIANVLSGSEVNPFDSHEARAFIGESLEIKAVQHLRESYQTDDINLFEFVVTNPMNKIVNDSFLKEYVAELLETIRTRVLLKIVRPYTRVTFATLAKELNLERNEEVLEGLLIRLILQKQLKAKIDHVSKFIVMDKEESQQDKIFTSITRWADRLDSMRNDLAGRIASIQINLSKDLGIS